jgi:hypothetical protein
MTRPVSLLLPDPQTVADLRRYVARAARVDAGGAVRLLGRQDALAVYVAPLHATAGPTVLGLRVLRLAGRCELDLTTSLAVLAERLDRMSRLLVASGSMIPSSGHELELGLPEAGPGTATWAGISPPRQGWEPVGLVDPADLRSVVAAGVAEIVTGTPPTAGGAQVAAFRARVWGRPLVEQLPRTPSGLAFAADALAFLDDVEPAALYRCGPWSRLTTSRGHVLGRPPMLTGLAAESVARGSRPGAPVSRPGC